MEHRWSDRIPSSIEVLLFHNNIPVVTCKAGNISHYGMFVKTGPVRYERNSQLEVEFVFNAKGRKKRYRIPAYVIHNSKDGLGLMYGDDSQDTINYIKGVIQGMPLEDSDENYPVKRKLSSELLSVSNKVIRDAGVG